jgi:hypothetical protein
MLMRVTKSGSRATSTIMSRSLPTIAGGVAAGANMPFITIELALLTSRV